jgi:serine/threonine protein phosphatase PrpC
VAPTNPARPSGFASVASISKYGVAGEGEDAVAEGRSESGVVRGIIVADGIGSHALAKEGAQFAAVAAQKQILHWTDESNLFALFRSVHQQIMSNGLPLIETFEEKPPRQNTCGTTLIVAIETEHEFQIGYVGNGAILHFRPHLIAQSRLRRFTWSGLNYLNPHSEEEQGREALFRYLSLDDNTQRAMPSVITLSKDPILGDILVICSDGVHSSDHIVIGVDPDGNVLQTTGAPLVELYELIRDSLLRCDSGIPEDLLSRYLSSCFEKRLFDDDASLGICISDQALDFVRNRLSST